jgi:hypothetical protein
MAVMPPNKPLHATVPPQGHRSIIEKPACAAGPRVNGKPFDRLARIIMSTWARMRQFVDRSAKQAAPWVARAAGAIAVAVGVHTFWSGIGQKFLQPFIGGTLLAVLGFGVLLLRQTALKLATIFLVAAAIMLPFGVLNPFAEMDAPRPRFYPPGYEDHRILWVMTGSAVSLLLAHLIGVARLQRIAPTPKANTVPPSER